MGYNVILKNEFEYTDYDFVQSLDSGFYKVKSDHDYTFVKHDTFCDNLIDIGNELSDFYNDLTIFMEKENEYKKYSLLHKRGYLLYGPPGTGKTSMSYLIAKNFIKHTNGLAFIVNERHDLRFCVNTLKKTEPDRYVCFVMEDSEGLLDDSFVLSVLDGQNSINNSIFIATTNYKEKLPPRITSRKGRFDIVKYIPSLTKNTQKNYLLTLLSRNEEITNAAATANEIVETFSDINIVMSTLKEIFVLHVIMGKSLSSIKESLEEDVGGSTDDDSNDYLHENFDD